MGFDKMYTAVRVFNRVWLAKLEQCEIARAAGFDGGEWSGEYHDELEADAYDDILEDVAEEFGLDIDALHDAIIADLYSQEG